MSTEGLAAAQRKMQAAGVGQTAIDVFTRYYQQLESGTTGLIAEAQIEPLPDPESLADIQVSAQEAQEAFAKTVIVKLNGGLGTSMGLARAKSLLPVRDGANFLDLIVRQVLAARAAHGVRLPLVLMDSFSTHDDTLAALAKYPELAVAGLPLDFVQSQEPKLTADSLEPVQWPADPELEWCPPGHGDIYPALRDSGTLDALLDAGFRYAAVSNADNLGAAPDAKLAGWFARSGAGFAIEVCRRTANDVKGGHLALRKSDGRIILRERAQCPDEAERYFTDGHRYAWFNTNNLWFDLKELKAALDEHGGVLGLPLIVNHKTVDPKDGSSPAVIQIESAMGAAIEVFSNSRVVAVERERFVPVKKTNELLLLRSDVYEIGDDGRLRATVDEIPAVDLDSEFYGKIDDFEQRIPQPPSLLWATSLKVVGDHVFGRDVTVTGAAEVSGDEGAIEDGAQLGGSE